MAAIDWPIIDMCLNDMTSMYLASPNWHMIGMCLTGADWGSLVMVCIVIHTYRPVLHSVGGLK